MVTQTYDAALRQSGLRATQFTLLSVLSKMGEVRQTEVAERMGMDGTTLTRNLQPLAQKGLVEITRDVDQRVRLLKLSEDGQRVFDEAVPLWREAQSQYVKGLGGKKLAKLLKALSATANIAHPE